MTHLPARNTRNGLLSTLLVSTSLVSTSFLGLVATSQLSATAQSRPQLQTPIVVAQASADDFYRRGNLQFDRQDYMSAIESYTRSIQINPNADNAYNNRGNARLALKDYQGAISDYNRALRINPNHSLAYYNRGLAYSRLGNHRDAILNYTQAIRVNPSYALAYNNRGVSRSALGDHAGAIEDYNRAIRLDPNYSRSITNRADAQRLLARQMASGGNTRYQGREPLPPRVDPTESRYPSRVDPTTSGRLPPRIDPTERRYPSRVDPTTSGRVPPRIEPNYPQPPRPPFNQNESAPRSGFQPRPADPTGNPNPTPVRSTPNPNINPNNTPNTTGPVAAANTTPANPVGINVYQIAKDTTVLISGQNPGSGVIIGRSGNTYFVLTAKHVVASPDEYKIVASNTKEYGIDYSKVRKLNSLDLAVVEFTSSETLPIARLATSDQINQGDVIFVSGWPHVSDGITRPTHQVTDGRITGLQRGDTDGYELTYSNPTAPGMSGGPVFSANGQVIGIHGRAAGNQDIGKVGINLGIPMHLFIKIAPQIGLNLQQLGLRP
jgi:Tfp pilus assembly protein PilF